LSWQCEVLNKKTVSVEKLINLLYSTAYRLTGDHQNAKNLVRKIVCDVNLGQPHSVVIKQMCTVFLADNAAGTQLSDCAAITSIAGNPIGAGTGVQDSLLYLNPVERMAVILRDVLGFSYVEIAEATLLSEKDVAGKIASARWALVKC